MRRFWIIVGALVGGVAASHLFDLAFDKQGVADATLTNLLGAVPGLLAGIVMVSLEKVHKWELLSSLIFGVFSAIVCAAGLAAYQLGFTNELAAVSVGGYLAFLAVLSVAVGASAGFFSWFTNKVY